MVVGHNCGIDIHIICILLGLSTTWYECMLLPLFGGLCGSLDVKPQKNWLGYSYWYAVLYPFSSWNKIILGRTNSDIL